MVKATEKEKIVRINPNDPDWTIPKNPIRTEDVYDAEGNYVWTAYIVRRTEK